MKITIQGIEVDGDVDSLVLFAKRFTGKKGEVLNGLKCRYCGDPLFNQCKIACPKEECQRQRKSLTQKKTRYRKARTTPTHRWTPEEVGLVAQLAHPFNHETITELAKTFSVSTQTLKSKWYSLRDHGLITNV